MTASLNWYVSSTAAVNEALGQSEAVSAQVGLFRNRTLVCWLEKSEDNSHSQSGSSAPVEVVTAEELEGWSEYTLPERSLEAGKGDTIEFAALITDEYGRQFMCPDFGFVVQNGALEYPGYKEFSSDPADWTF